MSDLTVDWAELRHLGAISNNLATDIHPEIVTRGADGFGMRNVAEAYAEFAAKWLGVAERGQHHLFELCRHLEAASDSYEQTETSTASSAAAQAATIPTISKVVGKGGGGR